MKTEAVSVLKPRKGNKKMKNKVSKVSPKETITKKTVELSLTGTAPRGLKPKVLSVQNINLQNIVKSLSNNRLKSVDEINKSKPTTKVEKSGKRKNAASADDKMAVTRLPKDCENAAARGPKNKRPKPVAVADEAGAVKKKVKVNPKVESAILAALEKPVISKEKKKAARNTGLEETTVQPENSKESKKIAPKSAKIRSKPIAAVDTTISKSKATKATKEAASIAKKPAENVKVAVSKKENKIAPKIENKSTIAKESENVKPVKSFPKELEDSGASKSTKNRKKVAPKIEKKSTIAKESENVKPVKSFSKELEDSGASKSTKNRKKVAPKIEKKSTIANESGKVKSVKSIPKELVNSGDLKLTKQHILSSIKAIKKLTQKILNKKKALLPSENHPIFLQVTPVKVPKTPRRQIRPVLPHAMINSMDDVAIFVADLVAGRRQDFEKTVEHWEEKFREKGVTGIKQIIPMNQIKTEYGQFEMKKKLAASFDHFLADGRICGHLSHLLGSSFFKRRNHPTPVHIERADLKREIDIALRKTCMTVHSFGDSHSVQIGTISMKSPKLADNVWAVCTSLAAEYPGGWANIRVVKIKTSISPSIPIYMNLVSKNAVPVPVVKPKRPRAYETVEGELTTISGGPATVTVTPEGRVTVKQEKREIKKEADNEDKVKREKTENTDDEDDEKVDSESENEEEEDDEDNDEEKDESDDDE